MGSDKVKKMLPPQERIYWWMEHEGMTAVHAFSIASLEKQIDDWPSAWGDDLEILLYGDFDPPDQTLHFPELGINVHPEIQKNHSFGSAFVLKASVEISERNVPGIVDAARRINILLGAWTIAGWGNYACGWWSEIICGSRL